MFRFIELELHGWDLWPGIRIPLDGDIVVLSGPNGSGKTTMLDAIRQILNATKLSQSRRLAHYLRHPNQPALVRAVVTNQSGPRGRRPFDVQRIHTDEATLACAIVPNGGIPEKRFAVLPGRISAQELQQQLLNGRDWLRPDQYRRVLDHAGVSRSLMHILALEQGRADELSRKTPRELYGWVMQARGSQQILERYNSARLQYQESLKEVHAQKVQVINQNTELVQIERKVRRLDEYERQTQQMADAEALLIAAQLAAKISESLETEKKLPELRTKIANFVTHVDRLKRELVDDESKLERLRDGVAAAQADEQKAMSERDRCHEERTRHKTEWNRALEEASRLRLISEDDAGALSVELEKSRRELFAVERQFTALDSETKDLAERVKKLELGVPVFPSAVSQTLASMEAAGITAVLAATHIEIQDSQWTSPFESALGPLRFALVVPEKDRGAAIEIADKFNFPGPLTTAICESDVVAGSMHVAAGAPAWISSWLNSVQVGANGRRNDAFGTWVERVDNVVLGGNAIRVQLEATRHRLLDVETEVRTAAQERGQAAQVVEDLERRLEQQLRRRELPRLEAHAVALEEQWRNADIRFNEADRVWIAANEAVREAERRLNSADVAIRDKRRDLANKSAELDGFRNTVAEADRRLMELRPEIEGLAIGCSAEMKLRAESGNILISPERAAGDVKSLRDTLDRFLNEGPIPPESAREEKKLVERNIDELERHVAERQREADAAHGELDRCRGEYLNVIGSTLHDYRRRAYALAEIARAKLEIELPKLENDDKSIDEAGIFVRIGFDGKPPTEIGDTAHSGGQQVIAGLILLMAMSETEGDSFFIVDEPFAHLSLDRVDEVGRFLRGSGSQFLITVPTTLDRGQLDPASLLVVLRKKNPQEPFAPRPIVARA